MALGTAHRHAHPDRSGRGDPVDHGIKPILQRIDSTLFIQHRVAMKSGCNAVIICGARQHVARQLTNCELVKRHVLIQSPNDPVSIRPD